MVKRNFLLFIGFILLVAVAGPPVQAGGDHHHRWRDKEVRVDLRVAGAFYNGLAQLPNPDEGVFLFHTEAKGKPGSATIVGVNQGPGTGNLPPVLVGDFEGCFEGANLVQFPDLDPNATQNENSLVATFEDLSVLNMAKDVTRLGEAFNCIGFFPPRFDFVVPIIFVGGFGRFEGATGTGIATGQSMTIQGSNFGSEIGTIKGTIILP
jgi:hypothetical protein